MAPAKPLNICDVTVKTGCLIGSYFGIREPGNPSSPGIGGRPGNCGRAVALRIYKIFLKIHIHFKSTQLIYAKKF